MKKWVESGQFDRNANDLLDFINAVIPWIVVFLGGVITGCGWMIMQRGKLPPF